MKAEHKAYLALIVAMLCWSTSGIAIKQALLVFTPLTLIVCRFTLSVSLMFLIGKLAGIFAKNATQPENLENNPAGFGATSDNSLSGFQEASGEAYHTNPAGFGANPDNIGEAYHTSPDSLAGPNQPFISTSSGETPTSQPSATPNNPEAAYQTPSENPAKASNPLAFFALTPLAKHDIPLFLIAGFLQPFLYYLAETYAYQLLSSPTIAEALLSTSPLLSPIFAFIAIRERLSRQTLIGILVSTLGMLLITLQFTDSFSLGNPWGILLAFVAVTVAIFYTIYLKKIPERYNSLSIVFYVQLFALLFFLITWLLQGGIHQAQALTQANPQALHKAFAMATYLAVFSSIIAFVLFCYAVRIVGVNKANAFNNVRPVFTALIMLLFFGEMLPIAKWIGILLVVGGLFYSSKQT